MVDWITMHTAGGRMQNATWVETVENVVRASRGLSERGVQQEKISLDDRGQQQVENWIQKLIAERIREERGESMELSVEAGEEIAA